MEQNKSQPVHSSLNGGSGRSEVQLDAFGGFDQVEAPLSPMAGSQPGQLVDQSVDHPVDHPVDHIARQSIWVSMPNNEQFHLRRFTPVFGEGTPIAELQQLASRHAAAPRRIFMLHGEAESGKVFYNESGQGLAWYFARQGYEVFVADLGHRGRSLASETAESTLSVSELVNCAIPRLLRAIGQCPHNDEDQHFLRDSDEREAQIWVGHGFGSVMLAAAWARLEDDERKATEMIFFGGRRQHKPVGRMARLFHRLICHPMSAWLVHWRRYFPARRLMLGDVDESAEWFKVYARWMREEQWLDSDGYDYRAALQQNPVPAGLHFAATGDTVYAPTEDVRRFVEELGPHDARTVILDHSEGKSEKYNHLSMLHHPQAVEDVFPIAIEWLAARQVAAEGYSAWASEQANAADQANAAGAAQQQPASETFVEQKELNLCA